MREGRGIENHENRFADIEKREESGWNAGAGVPLGHVRKVMAKLQGHL